MSSMTKSTSSAETRCREGIIEQAVNGRNGPRGPS
jgi:hypothetical protein